MEETLHPDEIQALRAFSDSLSLAEEDISRIAGLPADRSRKAISWLITRGYLEVEKEKLSTIASLTELGKKYAELGIPELRIIRMLERNGVASISNIAKDIDLEEAEIRKSIGILKRQGIVQIEGESLGLTSKSFNHIIRVQRLIENMAKVGKIDFDNLTDEEKSIIESMHRKRGKSKGIFRVDERKYRFYSLTEKGTKVLSELKGEVSAEISQLTPELLKDGKWKTISLRKYNIGLKPKRIVGGGKHPYARFLDFVRSKFIAMGFVEITGSLVENEFWNMDALYMPQFHSARDIHDIYFVKEPKYSKEINKKLLDNVARTHSTGGDTPSRGWGYTFDKNRAHRLILRSQGTALSVRTLASNPQIPGKYFAIARCFRYDKIDATHLPDFFQIEGIVLSKDINFKTLLGLLELFAKEFAGSSEIKFVPCYFPFTEPSVELDVWHEKMGWVELGGAGIFRREVTYPFDIKVPVIAWGLGLDRMAMLTLDIQDIRDLFAPDLEFIRRRRICRQSP
ncbi:MAG TPA: phenylalanine--tRNA ligase subunit alpha [bacterium (Candidatus Stahlbacteria)]|nr:phenylalanine--tRNA ligase subunit alpha [Candidatus Stahlbacteria bacterium]